jgi:hypothetical protein
MTAAHDDAPDDVEPLRYLLGFGILAVTVALSNFPQLVQHPERFFDVPRPAEAVRTLQAVGYAAQMAIGLWLGLGLILAFRRGRRFAAILWPLTVALYFLPLPNARQDPALAPLLLIGAFSLTVAAWMLESATRQHA